MKIMSDFHAFRQLRTVKMMLSNMKEGHSFVC